MERVLALEKENDNLRCRLDALQREIQFHASPTRSAKKGQAQNETALGPVSANMRSSSTVLDDKLSGLSLTEEKEVRTPGKKVRKFTARKWDFMDEHEMDAYENIHLAT